MLTEAELVQIYREHTGPLYAFVSRRVGGDRTLAEDIVQDAWLRAVDTWPRRGTPDQPRAWLIRVARNLLVSHFRRQRPTPVDPAELELEADDYRPETRWAAALVSWGLARLRRGQAALLEAFYFDGRSTREIAAELGLSERAVEGRLRRARQNLEKRLRPYISAAAPAAAAAEPAVESVPALELSEGGRNNA
ncbi:MAG: sigma-70 family RNA polymerase sigma factor [Gemmatimonadota bacterium]|nr:MAG: sigma-70 family RNA polymerase sigma factor [Gemmatimonadota bacterium]